MNFYYFFIFWRVYMHNGMHAFKMFSNQITAQISMQRSSNTEMRPPLLWSSVENKLTSFENSFPVFIRTIY